MERSTGVMVAGTLLSRITGFGRTVALAYAIGQNALTDSYNLANTTPNIVYELVVGGVLSASLVALFVTALSRQPDGEPAIADPWREVSAVLSLVLVVSLAATAIFVAAAPQIIDSYLAADATADQRFVATTLLRLFGPQIVFYALITVSTAVLEARRRFAAPKFAPILNNVIVIVTVLALPYVSKDLALGKFRHDSAGMLLLGIGTTAGVAAMAVAQIARLGAAGAKIRLVWAPRTPMIRRLIGLSGWTVGVVVTNQIALFVAFHLATEVPGDLTAYTYAFIYFTLPHGVLAVSVMSAIAPDLTERWNRGDGAGLGRRVVGGLRQTLAVLGPAAAGLIITAGPLVAATIEHGRLGRGDADVTSTTLVWFAVGLPGFTVFLLLGRVWQSMHDTRTLFLLYLLENLLNIVFAYALHPRFGVQGLAAAFSLAYTLAAVAGLIVLNHRLPKGWATGLGVWSVRLCALSGAVALTAGASLVALRTAVPGTGAGALAELCVATAVGVITVVVAAPAVGVREPLSLMAPILRRLGLGGLVKTTTSES